MSRASQGLRAWLWQRASAVYLAVFVVVQSGYFLTGAPGSYSEWHGWIARPTVNIAFALAILAVLVHAWVGVRDVLMDYVRSPALRLAALGLVAGGLVACGVWGARVLILAGLR